MAGCAIYYDDAGNVIGTLDTLVARSADNQVVGLVDFEAEELAGRRMREVVGTMGWFSSVDGVTHYASGAGSWPEWIDGAAAFRVELDPAPAPARARIVALVHRRSGYRRERATIEAAIAAVAPDRRTGIKDLRAITGGPTHPLLLDANGRTIGPASG